MFLKKLQEKFIEQKPFVLYVVIGFTGLFIDLAIFIALVRYFAVNELIANPISASIGIINNFLLNAFFNFKKTDQLAKRFLAFYTVGVAGILVGNTFLWFFNDVVKNQVGSALGVISPILRSYQIEIIKGVSIVFIAVMQYFLNKRFSFRELPTSTTND